MAEDAVSNDKVLEIYDTSTSAATTSSAFASSGGTEVTPPPSLFKLWNPPTSGTASCTFEQLSLDATKIQCTL